MNLGATGSNGDYGGETDFYDCSSAGTATINNNGATGGVGGRGGVVQFFNSSKAGTAGIINNPGNDNDNGGMGGYTYFNAGTSADHATITNNGGIFDNYNHQSESGHTVFYSGSTADHATLIANATTYSPTGSPGEIDFNAGATAANATLIAYGAAVSGAPGGSIQFTGQYGNLASAGSASISANGGTVSGAPGGSIYFGGNSSTGATATITANGASVSGALGGIVQFDSTSTGGTATLIANGGTNGGGSGVIKFTGGTGIFPTGGTARVIANAGGIFDVSYASNLSVGSIEGAGRIQLGSQTLTSGSLNTDTTVSGLIVDGGLAGGTVGKIVKQGTGTLIFTGANTYTGTTTVSSGVLSTNLLANGGLASGFGQSSNAAANLVLNGGTFQYTGPAVSIDRLFTVSAAGGALDASGSGPLTFGNSGSVAFSGSGPAHAHAHRNEHGRQRTGPGDRRWDGRRHLARENRLRNLGPQLAQLVHRPHHHHGRNAPLRRQRHRTGNQHPGLYAGPRESRRQPELVRTARIGLQRQQRQNDHHHATRPLCRFE